MSDCDLERLPYDAMVNEGINAGSAESITLGTYAKLKEEYYYKTLHQVGEYGGDNISLSGTTSDQLFNFYRYTRVTNSYYTARVWLFTYQMVGNINSLLPALEEYDPPVDERESIDHLKGENLLLRAFLYFNCCNVFGRPYLDAAGAENNPGIPLKTVSDINYFPPRASVKDVYEQIIEDATRAAALMKRSPGTTPKNNSYVSQEVAWAFLSRVYLYMGAYEKAEAYADSVINAGRYSLLEDDSYAKYPQHAPESNTESIWVIRMLKDVDFEAYYMDWYSVGSLYATLDEIGWGEMYPSESYLALLRENPEDLRFKFIADQYEATNSLWMIYTVGNEANKTWTYATQTVVQEGDDYRITTNANLYTSPLVQKETIDGKTQYYVVTVAGSVRYNVHIERALQARNGYPKRFILKCSYQEQQSQLYSPVLFRLAEIYLTRAESRFYQNDIAGAIEDMNVIRRRAKIPERQYADAGSDADVLEWILNERRLELAWEAQRKYDIFRKQQTLDRRYPGSHLASALPIEIRPDDDRIVEYIPVSEIDAYPGDLQQNP
jgi:hypothetical protein